MHIFIAETTGLMDSMQLKGIEKVKIDCAKNLFNEMSTSKVRYHEVDSYDSLLKVMEALQRFRSRLCVGKMGERGCRGC